MTRRVSKGLESNGELSIGELCGTLTEGLPWQPDARENGFQRACTWRRIPRFYTLFEFGRASDGSQHRITTEYFAMTCVDAGDISISGLWSISSYNINLDSGLYSASRSQLPFVKIDEAKRRLAESRRVTISIGLDVPNPEDELACQQALGLAHADGVMLFVPS